MSRAVVHGPWWKILPEFLAGKVIAKRADCWLVKPNPGNAGYLRFTYRGVTQYAHRTAYQLTRGSIQKGLVIDHLCRSRDCINPEHLELVTAKENVPRPRREPC